MDVRKWLIMIERKTTAVLIVGCVVEFMDRKSSKLDMKFDTIWISFVNGYISTCILRQELEP